MIVYVLCAVTEIVLYVVREYAVGIANRHFAATQMSISAGYIYGEVIKGINITWGFLAIAAAAVGVLYYLLMQKGRSE